MKNRLLSIFCYFLLFLSLWACKTTQIPQQNNTSTDVTFQILQLNDVYEIAPLEGGKVAGMARVATLRDKLLAKNPNTLTILAGDFLSPSLTGTLKDKELGGERIQGLHMVETMNALGVDYVAFGNHEFDISKEALQRAIDASNFMWVAGNVLQRKGDTILPFQKNIQGIENPLPEYVIHTFKNTEEKTLRLGILTVTLPFNKAPYVHYADIFTHTRNTYERIKDKADVFIIISHLEIADDKKLAEMMPEISLIMGGHDHNNMKVKASNNYITKADANAKTVYVHTFKLNLESPKKLIIDSELIKIDESLDFQPKTQAVVNKWQQKADESMKAMGYTPEAVVFETKELLDGREQSVRYQPTNLGQMIAKSMLKANKDVQVALLNSGSIRIDDQLTGALTQSDILRILPYGGEIQQSTWLGADLLKVLEIGLNTNKGLGGYLQYAGISQDKDQNWIINGEKIALKASYQVVLPKFLAEGKEANLGFLKEIPAYDVNTQSSLDVPNDIRQVLIHYLKNQF